MKLTGGRRLAALAGLAAFVLGALGAAIYPSGEPAFLDEPAKIASFYGDNADGVLASEVLFLFSGIGLFFFVGVLRSVLASAEGGDGWLATTAFGAGIAGCGMLVAGASIETGAVLRVDERGAIDPQVATLANDASAILFGLAAPTAFAVLVLASAAVAWRTRVLPRWHAGVSVALGIGLALPPISHAVMVPFMVWAGVTGLVLVLVPLPQTRVSGAPRTATAA